MQYLLKKVPWFGSTKKFLVLRTKYGAQSKIYGSQAVSEWFFAYNYVIIPLILKNAYKKIPKIYQIINIFRMMFVYHYVIIPFHPQYLPKHAPSNIAKWREQRWREPLGQNCQVFSTSYNPGLLIFSEKQFCSNNEPYCPLHSCKKLVRSL